MEIYKKTSIILALIIVALLSIVIVTPIVTDVDTHTHTIQQLDREIDSVLKLTGGATAASAGISLLPDDQCTPIAQEFAELGTYFLIVLSALYLEKYLVTMIGYISFSIIVPLACVLLGIGIFTKREKAMGFSVKLFISALVIYFVIPLSVTTSETVYNNYEESIEQTINIADEISVVDEDENAMERFVGWIENAAGTIVDYVTGLLSRFIEAIAIMLVTSCLIPILVVFFASWILKIMFKVDFSLTDMERFMMKRK